MGASRGISFIVSPGASRVKTYDLVYVIKPDLDPEAIKAVVDRTSQRIQDQGGVIEVVDVWGKKRTSSRLKKYREGVFVHTRFALDGQKVSELRRAVTLNEEVLRAVVTNAVGPTPQPKVTAAAAPTPAAPPSAQAPSVAQAPPSEAGSPRA